MRRSNKSFSCVGFLKRSFSFLFFFFASGYPFFSPFLSSYRLKSQLALCFSFLSHLEEGIELMYGRIFRFLDRSSFVSPLAISTAFDCPDTLCIGSRKIVSIENSFSRCWSTRSNRQQKTKMNIAIPLILLLLNASASVDYQRTGRWERGIDSLLRGMSGPRRIAQSLTDLGLLGGRGVEHLEVKMNIFYHWFFLAFCFYSFYPLCV